MLSDVLKDTNGNTSTTRLILFVITTVFIGTWGWLSIQKGEMQPIDMEQLMLILGAFGFKVAQRSIEKEN